MIEEILSSDAIKITLGVIVGLLVTMAVDR